MPTGALDETAPAIRVENFDKLYRDTVAVSGLSFTVEAGQILAMVGPNGAGKTTTLRSLAGIIPPTRGRVSVAGYDLSTDPVSAKARLAYVPDDPKLFEALTIDEHMEFVAATYRVDSWKVRADELLTQFQLAEHRRKTGQELSRGMRQKVAVCCAYLHDPAVILLDEPFTGLDPRSIRTLNDSIVESARRGTAVLLSSHLLNMVNNLCTHVLILHRGRRRFCGTLDELRELAGAEGPGTTLEDVFLRVTEGALDAVVVEPQADGEPAADETP